MNRQFEPCEHRHGSGLMGTYVDHYSTPCPLCAAADTNTVNAAKVAFVLLLVVIALTVALS